MKNGWTHFTTDIEESGGIQGLVKTNYARNMWRIMEKFNVLPTNPDFQRLTTEQISFIIENMVLDNKEAALARQGKRPGEYFEDSDSSWLDEDINSFDPVRDDHQEEDIYAQVRAMSGQEEYERARERYRSVDEWNEFVESGGRAADDLEKERYYQEQLQKVMEEAKQRSAMAERRQTAADLLNSEHDNEEYF